MAMSNECEIMTEIGWIQNVMAVVVRDNVNRDDEKIDITMAVEGANKVADASPSSKACIEMKDDFKLDVGTVVDKVLVKRRCCCGCKKAASFLRARRGGRGRCKCARCCKDDASLLC